MGLSYDDLTFYVARDSKAILAALAEGADANRRFRRRAKDAARAVCPPGRWREPVVAGYGGTARVVGLEWMPDDYDGAPEDWKFVKSHPARIEPKATKRGREISERLAKAGHHTDLRLNVPGLGPAGMNQLPGMVAIDGRVYLYRSVRGGGLVVGAPLDIDEDHWRPIKHSTFYRAVESGTVESGTVEPLGGAV